MATYTYPKPAAQQEGLHLLQQQLIAAGLPVLYLSGSSATDEISVITERDLTPEEQAQLAAAVAAFDGRPRRLRSLFAIYQALVALTAAQRTAVWNDLQAPVVTTQWPGGVPRWALDEGTNAGAIMTLHWAANNSGAAAVALNDARARLAAAYVQDNPAYLVHPGFDTTINVPGDEPTQ